MYELLSAAIILIIVKLVPSFSGQASLRGNDCFCGSDLSAFRALVLYSSVLINRLELWTKETHMSTCSYVKYNYILLLFCSWVHEHTCSKTLWTFLSGEAGSEDGCPMDLCPWDLELPCSFFYITDMILVSLVRIIGWRSIPFILSSPERSCLITVMPASSK
jgi:hypothetical protein